MSSWGLPLTVAAIPLLDRMTGGFRLAEILVVLLFATCLKRPVKLYSVFTLMLLLLVAFSVVAVDGVNEYSIKLFFSIALGAVYVFVISQNFSSKRPHRLFFAISIAASLHSIVLILSAIYPGLLPSLIYYQSEVGRTIFDVKLPFVRSAGLFNHYGYNTAFTIAGVLSAFYVRSKLAVGIFIGCVILNLAALFISQSRLGWFLAILIIGFFSFEYRKFFPSYVRFFFWIVAFVVISLIWTNLELLWQTFVMVKKLSVDVRMEQNATGIELFLQSPVVGAGYSEYFKYNHEHALHNGWITLLYSVGGVGLTFFLLAILLPPLRYFTSESLALSGVAIASAGLVMTTTSGIGFFSVWLLFGVAHLFLLSGSLEGGGPKRSSPLYSKPN